MYNYEVVTKVKEILDKRRTEARSLSKARSAELRLKSPELCKIDDELSGTGPLIFKTACEGGDIEPIKLRNRELNARRREIIKSLGYPEDYTDVKYTCPKCQDTGYVDVKTCSCLSELLFTENIKASGMGRLIEEQSFENFDMSVFEGNEELKRGMEKNLKLAKRFAENFGNETAEVNLVLIGKTGSGKTHISTAIARRVISRGYSVLYDSAQNIVSAFEYDRFHSGYGNVEPTADKFLECDLLIVDDLGTEFVNSFTVSVLYNILNTRYNRGLYTIISTNLSASELSRTYDDRICSRILGRDSVILLFEGKDYRLGGKRRKAPKKD